VVRPSTRVEHDKLVARRWREREEARKHPSAEGTTPVTGWRARMAEQNRINRAAQDQATADPDRSPLGGLGDNWHPATKRRLERLRSLGWHPPDHVLEQAHTVLDQSEPSGAWYGRRSPSKDAPLLFKAAGLLLLVPLLAIAAVLIGIIGLLMVFLSIWPILWFYALPLYFVVLPLHELLRAGELPW